MHPPILLVGGRTVEPDLIATLKKDGARRWSVWLGDEQLVPPHRDPEHAAARVLHERGEFGTILFVHADTGSLGVVLDIERAAGRMVSERSGDGLRVTPVTTFPEKAPQETEDAAVTQLHEFGVLRETEGTVTPVHPVFDENCSDGSD
jgi:hypothetical protein